MSFPRKMCETHASFVFGGLSELESKTEIKAETWA